MVLGVDACTLNVWDSVRCESVALKREELSPILCSSVRDIPERLQIFI